MTATQAEGRTATAALSRRRDALRRWLGDEDRSLFALLMLMTVAGAVLVEVYEPVTAAVLMIPLLLTDLLLSPRLVPAFVTFLFVVLCVETVWEYQDGIPARRWVAIGIVVVMSAIVWLVSWRRSRLGVAGLRGDSMLVDLQDRINRQAELPPLPGGWAVQSATRSAGGTSFAGDFMVAQLADDAPRLNLALVDVSGKGVDAGTRSLLLCGAFGGLLGAVPPSDFLPSANEYLLRQGWTEGFATAVHLALDLETGAFQLRGAGHPPAIQFVAGSGRWLVHDAVEGPVLGCVEDASYAMTPGRLSHGDALFLYTDGLVERPRRDIGLGIDKLIGEGERLVRHGFDGAARLLVDKLGASNDDCALIVLQRV